MTLSVLFWLTAGLLAAVRLSKGDRHALLGLGLSIALAGALVAGTFLRGIRYRRDRHDLGIELRTKSAQLLTRLEAAPWPRRAGFPLYENTRRIPRGRHAQLA